MTVDRTIQGAWRVSDIIAGVLVTRHYFFYTKKEAIAQFKLDTKET